MSDGAVQEHPLIKIPDDTFILEAGMAGIFFSVGGGRTDVDTRAIVYVLMLSIARLNLEPVICIFSPECTDRKSVV